MTDLVTQNLRPRSDRSYPGTKMDIIQTHQCPGARFSKDPITYRARKAIFSDLYLKKKAVFRH